MNDIWQHFLTFRDVDSRNALALHYLKLVKIIAGRLAISLPPSVDRDDLESAGFFGLLDSLSRFDPSRGIKFETFASPRIRGSMLDFLRNRDWLPPSSRSKLRSFQQTLSNLENSLGRFPSDSEIADSLGCNLQAVSQLFQLAASSSLLPLDDVSSLHAPNSDPLHAAVVNDISRSLSSAIDKLNEKERLVVSLYYYDQLTLKEIANILGLSEARICQIHSKAICRLRGSLSKLKASLFQ